MRELPVSKPHFLQNASPIYWSLSCDPKPCPSSTGTGIRNREMVKLQKCCWVGWLISAQSLIGLIGGSWRHLATYKPDSNSRFLQRPTNLAAIAGVYKFCRFQKVMPCRDCSLRLVHVWEPGGRYRYIATEWFPLVIGCYRLYVLFAW